MILGDSTLGLTPLGVAGNESIFFESEPPAVVVEVAAFAPTAYSMFVPPSATVQVTAGVPVVYIGGASYPSAAVVVVRAKRVRAGLKSVVGNPGAIQVSGRTPVSLVVSAPAAARVEVRGVPMSGGVQVVLPSAAINVAGNAPVSGATAGGSPAMVAVAGWAPVAKAVSGQSPVSVVVRGAAPKAAALTVTPPAGVNVAAGAVTSQLCVLPLSALVWVRCGVIAEQETASGGLIVVLNTNTLAVSEYTVPALDVVTYEGVLHFVQADGLATLDLATTDPGDVVALLESGMLALGTDGKKYVPRFNATLSGDSVTEAWATIELDGDSIEIGPYELPGRSGPASFVRKWRLAGGIKADSISLRFEGKAGTAWKLQGLTIDAELV